MDEIMRQVRSTYLLAKSSGKHQGVWYSLRRSCPLYDECSINFVETECQVLLRVVYSRTRMELSHSGVVCITKREKAESEAQRGKPKGTLESEIRSATSLWGESPCHARRAILVWERRDRSPRRSVGKGACVCACGYDLTPGQGNP